MTRTQRFKAELRAILVLGAPLIAHNLAVAAMMFVDTVMAGRLSALDLGAVAVGGGIFWPAFGFVLGVMMAVTATVAHLYGAGEHGRMGHIRHQATLLALVAAAVSMVIFWCAEPFLVWIGTDPTLVPKTSEYLRALSLGMPAACMYQVLRFTSEGLGRTTPLIAMALIGVGCNILGNWVFMWGNLGVPALGALGCGLATAFSFWVMYFALRFHLRTHRFYTPFALFPPREGMVWTTQQELLVLGAPIGVMVFMETSLFAAAALMMGTLGAATVAGHQIALNWAAFMFMIPLGLGLATTIRVGHALGAGDHAAARFSGWTGIAAATGFMVGSALFMLAARDLIVGLYTRDATVAAVAVSLLIWAAIFQIADGMQAAAAGALRGYKDTQVPALITVVAYWGVGLTLSWGLGMYKEMGPHGIWAGLTASLVAVAIGLTWRYARISREKGSNSIS
jgi:MATE family multidrug resistance protein